MYLAGRLPTWTAADDLHVEPLPGGWTNENYRLQLGDDAFVLRVSGEHAETLGVDREHEREVAERAWQAGLAPELVRFVFPAGVLLATASRLPMKARAGSCST